MEGEWKEEAVLIGNLQSHKIKPLFQKIPQSNPLILNKYCVKTKVKWNKTVAGKVTNELVFFLINCSYNISVSHACDMFHTISHWTDIGSKKRIYVNVNTNVMSHIDKNAPTTAQMHT
jgi:hypothetical protein